MKFEVDLDQILGDEDGIETLEESVRRQVVENISSTIKIGVMKSVNEQTAKILDEEIRKSVQIQMPQIVNDLMHTEYVPVTQYGGAGKPTTFREQLVKAVQDHMVYKKTTYSSERNAFTKAVDEVIEEHIKVFKSDFTKLVDSKYKEEAVTYAVNLLREKLKL